MVEPHVPERAEARGGGLSMWFALEQGRSRVLHLRDEQSIWPAPDGSDATLVIVTDVDLEQQVVLATPRVFRLRYEVRASDAQMILGDNPPAPWPDATRIAGRSFEVMVTDRGPLLVPSEGDKLPNRIASWLENVVENVRSVWPVPPDDCKPGSEWEMTPALPGGLPPHTKSAKIRVRYRVEAAEEDRADISVRFGMRAVIKPPRVSEPHTGEGRGELTVKLLKSFGVARATRAGVMEIVRPNAPRNQVIRSRMELQRVG